MSLPFLLKEVRDKDGWVFFSVSFLYFRNLSLNASQANWSLVIKPRQGLAPGQAWRWYAVGFQLTDIFSAQLFSGC